jgi:two-component system, NarL family, invasion response regulator UvrY
MLKILVADDHTIVRKGLIQILSELDGLQSIDEACHGQEVLDLVAKNEYDIVVLDITMPGQSGLSILKQLKSENPDLPVLILSMHPEDQYAFRTIKAGASGYLTKESAPDELIKAIMQISTGRKYISPSVAEKLASELMGDHTKPIHETLSNREFEVLKLIGSGKSVSEISDILCLSVKTISTYRSRLLDKMNLKNSAELIHYAIKMDLVD